MTLMLTEKYIARLENLKAAERARLRQLSGQSLDSKLEGFDLFTGLWWPLRQRSPHAPERRSAWLVAKLYGALPLPHVREGPRLASLLGRSEPRDEFGLKRFRQRFDALLQSPLANLEPPLSWALQIARKRAAQGRDRGLDWAQLLEDLRWWDRGLEGPRDIREEWAKQYLQAVWKGK